MPFVKIREAAQDRTNGTISFPDSLIFNDNLPVDQSEIPKKLAKKAAYVAENSLIEGYDLMFNQLPVEVQQVVDYTFPDLKKGDVLFNIIRNVVLGKVNKRGKEGLVYEYLYFCYSKETTPGQPDPNRRDWRFMRQNKLLRLTGIE